MSGSKKGRGITWGAAVHGLGGATLHGDRYVVKERDGQTLIAAIDALGHGSEAAYAADRALAVIEIDAGSTLVELIQRCHAALRDTRGVVMTAAIISHATGAFSWIGVGNVVGMIQRKEAEEDAGGKDFVVMRGGVVGHTLPRLRAEALTLNVGDTLVLATDGVGIAFTMEELAHGSPEALARRILERHAKPTDDALALVVRYTGE